MWGWGWGVVGCRWKAELRLGVGGVAEVTA